MDLSLAWLRCYLCCLYTAHRIHGFSITELQGGLYFSVSLHKVMTFQTRNSLFQISAVVDVDLAYVCLHRVLAGCVPTFHSNILPQS
jgi:hypothetical protein